MQAIRKIKEITDRQIVIDLPRGFEAKEVEVIILPVRPKRRKHAEKMSELLLKGPSLSKNEVERIKQVKNWLGEWTIPQS